MQFSSQTLCVGLTHVECMQGAKVLSLDIALLLAGAKERGELESRLKKVITEISASKIPIILFIDELHTAVGTGMQSTPRRWSHSIRCFTAPVVLCFYLCAPI